MLTGTASADFLNVFFFPGPVSLFGAGGNDTLWGSCGVGSWGSWGGQRPRMGGYVAATGARDRVTAARRP